LQQFTVWQPQDLRTLHRLFEECSEPRLLAVSSRAGGGAATLCRLTSCMPQPGSAGGVRLRLLALQRVLLGGPIASGDAEGMRCIAPLPDGDASDSAAAARDALAQLDASAADEPALAAARLQLSGSLAEAAAGDAAAAEGVSWRLCALLASRMPASARREAVETRSTARRLRLAAAAVAAPEAEERGRWDARGLLGAATGAVSTCAVA